MAIDFSVPAASRSSGGHSLCLSPGHEFHNAFPVFAAALWAKFFLKNRQLWSVEFLRLRNAHLMNFKSNDGEPRAGKYFIDPCPAADLET